MPTREYIVVFVSKRNTLLTPLAPRPIDISTSTPGKRAVVVGALSVALRALHEEFFGIAELTGSVQLSPQHAS